MNYSDMEMRRIGVDPKTWSWFNKDYSRYQVMDPSPVAHELKQITRVKPGRFMLFLAAFCVLVALTSIPAPGARSIFPSSAAAIFLLVLFAAFCMSRRTWMKVIGSIMGCVLVIAELACMFMGNIASAFLLVVLVVCAAGVARLFVRSLYFDGRMVESANRLTGAELWSNPAQRVYGNPGGVASAVKKFGQEAVDAGVEGEERTAVLLWLLLRIPGVTVFHGLRFPNTRDADVDHAVVHGNNVYLIDSKMYRWGEYEWQKHPKYGEQIARTDGYGIPKQNHMDAAAEGYRRILGESVNVIPIIIVHGKNVSVGANKWSSSGVALFTPDEAMRFMGETISHDLRTWRDNMNVRAGMLQNMKR